MWQGDGVPQVLKTISSDMSTLAHSVHVDGSDRECYSPTTRGAFLGPQLSLYLALLYSDFVAENQSRRPFVGCALSDCKLFHA